MLQLAGPASPRPCGGELEGLPSRFVDPALVQGIAMRVHVVPYWAACLLPIAARCTIAATVPRATPRERLLLGVR